jgi:hypothetical protein
MVTVVVQALNHYHDLFFKIVFMNFAGRGGAAEVVLQRGGMMCRIAP